MSVIRGSEPSCLQEAHIKAEAAASCCAWPESGWRWALSPSAHGNDAACWALSWASPAPALRCPNCCSPCASPGKSPAGVLPPAKVGRPRKWDVRDGGRHPPPAATARGLSLARVQPGPAAPPRVPQALGAGRLVSLMGRGGAWGSLWQGPCDPIRAAVALPASRLGTLLPFSPWGGWASPGPPPVGRGGCRGVQTRA